MKFLLALSLLIALASANVLVLTSNNFDANIGQSKPALVEFFAPWCGHCKKLAPEYEILGQAFRNKPVIIGSVDCDNEQNREICNRYDVSGYPTIKWISPKNAPETYSGAREAPALIDFVNQKTGLKVAVPGKAPSAVLTLTDSNFEEKVVNSDKDVLVKFYAPWCGHCKRMAPDYEKLAAIYANEDAVAVAELDCDEYKSACADQGVSGYPTIKYFAKGKKSSPEDYEGSRSLDSFVEFINERAGTQRNPDGTLGDKAGLIAEFDELVSKFKAATDKKSLVQEASELSARLGSKGAKIYAKIIEKSAADASFISSELDRIKRMLDGGSLQAKKIDEFTERVNILKQFQ